MPTIEVRDLRKGFGDNKVLRGLSFSVKEGEYVVVLGPSGCGKTTLLKTMVGLYEPDSGSVLLGGLDVTSIPAERRGIGFFFQHYHLFPHMSVRENVAYPMTARGAKKPEADAVASERLKLVGLAEWAEHFPSELSGGMQQRAALARTLATGSKILLLDEPLNALDAKTASILRGELKSLAKSLGYTVIHVTPNQEEAMELADRIILIKDGLIVQDASDIESYMRPANPFSAYFIGDTNFLGASRLEAHSARHHHTVITSTQEMPQETVVLAIRAEKVRFERHEHNTLTGVVDAVNFLGKTTRYDVNMQGRHIGVETSKHTGIKPGDEVAIYLPPEDVMVFPSLPPLAEEIEVI
jgi:ABC-type Fe3+/spermidine/putrescine transport system ATPase subunit